MAIFGIIIALVTSYFFGEYGITLIICISFGMVLSMYAKQKKLYSDIQKLKINVGIEDEQTIKLQFNEEEKANVKQYKFGHGQHNIEESNDLELSIEKELEQFEKHHNDLFNRRHHRSDK